MVARRWLSAFLIFVGFCLLPGGRAVAQGVECISCFAVSVTPDGGYDPDRSKNTNGYTTTFTVRNTGGTGATDNYNFSCSGTGGITCTNVSPTGAILNPGQSQLVTVTYNVGSSGGQIWAEAAGEAIDNGHHQVSTSPTMTLVFPKVTNVDTALIHTRTPLILVGYSTTDAPLDLATLVVKLGPDTVTTLTRNNSGLVEWEVDSAHQLQPGVVKTLTVRICHINAGCTTMTRQLLLDNSGPPIVSFTGMPLELHGNAAEVETGFGIPPYFSMGAARATGLAYSTRQSYPRALVNVDVELTWPVGNPSQIKAVLRDGVVKLDSFTVNSPTCQAAGGRRCRVTLQGDFSATTFPRATRKWLSVEVQVTKGSVPDTIKGTTDSVEVVLVDRRSSPYGSGWFVSGIARLDSAGTDMLLIGPTGAATLFRGSGGVYLSPPGDTRRLIWTGTQWELQSPFAGCGTTTKVVFDTQGRQTQAIDCHSNTTTVKYGATVDRVDTIIDPIGKRISFTFNGTPKLTTITDPGGRQSIVTIDASNQLVYDSIASPGSNSSVRTFAYTPYGTNNTLLLASQANALGHTTVYGYDSGRRRPNQTTLPAVLPETGTTPVSPVITYRAQVLRGLDTLVSADSIFGQMKDPLQHWTRTAANRWGAPLKVWDSLGTVLRAAYTPEGRSLWSEGKVADSTRLYNTWDTQGHLRRSYRLRALGDTVLIDSLVYDASHRVVKSYNALNQPTTFVYNSSGDVLKAVTPTGDTTRYRYLANGLLDSVRTPTQLGWTVYTFDGTWSNLFQVKSAATVVLSTRYNDAYGRDTLTLRKLTVRLRYDPVRDSNIAVMRWRRVITRYLVTNQLDSVRTEFTDECDDPCNTPPTWPTTLADSLKWQRVRYTYDRLGRETGRLNTRGLASSYAYDALGRLLSRRPFATITAERDSFRYDIAGNLRFHWTRRDTLIEHRYDSRNRDTLTIVPGVGNFHRFYNGPGDELTKDTVEGYVDPIGAVNPSVSWTYNQAGLLLTETAQGTRVTTHQYDRYGRDTSVTDAAGTWRLRYDAVRGVLDTVVTPFADSLVWTPDSLWRPIGPTIRNGSAPDFVGSRSWDQVGKLLATSNSDVVNVGTWNLPATGGEATVADLNLRPVWTEQQGSGGPTVTQTDTLVHDGWGRVTTVQYIKNGTSVTGDFFTFDRDGNINVGGGQISYDTLTTRLLQRATSYTYAYDRAGNLDTVRYVGSLVWVYKYDALDRLIEVRWGAGATLIARYAYDVLGRRIVKRVYNSGSGPPSLVAFTRMIYRGGQVAAETDSAGTLALAYTWGLGTDNLVAVHRYSPSADYYAVQDNLHSVRGLTQRDGTWLASWRFRIYGLEFDSAGTAPFLLRYRWTGREYDAEAQLYYFRERYYDPLVARFVQEDPIGFAGGTNLYTYGDGNPENGRDPDGLKKDYEAMNAQLGVWPHDDGLSECWTSHCGGGGGEGGADAWGQEDDYDDRWDESHPQGEAHTVSFCTGGSCSSVTFYATNNDFNPDLGHEKELVIAAARAAVANGFSSFNVSAFTSGHAFAPGDPHNSGNAMDVNYLGGHWVGRLSRSEVKGFVRALLSNTSFPGGSQVLGPFYNGYTKDNFGNWNWIHMNRYDTREGSPCQGCTWAEEHQSHFHISWGGGWGVPAY